MGVFEGYNGIFQFGDGNNMTISNNYIDGIGITRYWHTAGIFTSGVRNLLISNNEVTRTMGCGIMTKSPVLGKDYWDEQVLTFKILENKN